MKLIYQNNSFVVSIGRMEMRIPMLIPIHRNRDTVKY